LCEEANLKQDATNLKSNMRKKSFLQLSFDHLTLISTAPIHLTITIDLMLKELSTHTWFYGVSTIPL
jgi:hypothetical protein